MPADPTNVRPIRDVADGSTPSATSRQQHGEGTRKALGAYYTDAVVADFLVRWAVLTGHELVLDPGFGGGVFLTAAAERMRVLGGDPDRQVYGVEIDAAAYRAFADRCRTGHVSARLVHASFFDVGTDRLPPADAVVGNPPFIRYQRFNGAIRQAALYRAEDAGVRISELASSWAPFLVHAVQFVRPGGRLAMVVPAELAHAAYARPILEHLRRTFRTTRILTFARKLFPKLAEDTVLLLAAGRGEPFDSFTVIDLPNVSALGQYTEPATALPQGCRVDAGAVGRGDERLLHYLLPERTRTLYRQLQASANVASLGTLADAGVGYVTGDNEFFHVRKGTADLSNLPAEYLRPAVRNGAELSGLRFTPADWTALYDSGHACLLLLLPTDGPLPQSVQQYLRQGVERGVPDRYKCRVRTPWYSVPHVYRADGFLTSMSGSAPKLVANEAGVVAPNTLHILRLYPLQEARQLSALSLAALWQTSLTALSGEMEGHSLGGGMLKLEPTEAERVAIPLPNVPPSVLDGLARELDSLLRTGKGDRARELADTVILHDSLGLTRGEIQELADGWLMLKRRRLNR
ncbi:MAG: N-6 DNA methylase [Chloroflexi bacterium]|nr:N-6 DNA methylase [Chloroflexota bacterium]